MEGLMQRFRPNLLDGKFHGMVESEHGMWIHFGSIESIKRQAITELLEQHKKDRAKVSSKSDLINMPTVEKYLRSLG